LLNFGGDIKVNYNNWFGIYFNGSNGVVYGDRGIAQNDQLVRQSFTFNNTKINYYDNTVKRSLIVNDNLVTFSNKFLKINSLPNLQAIASLELTTAGDDYMITPVSENNATGSVATSSPNNASSTVPDLSSATTTEATTTATSTHP